MNTLATVSSNALSEYLENADSASLDAGFVAYLASLCETATVAPAIARSIVQELADQRSNLKLIASENYCSLATQLAMGNLLTDKYAEGYAQHRFYAGCDNVDDIEAFGTEAARKLFGCEHAYVQPHSGADANLIAFWAILTTRVQAPRLEKLNITNVSDASNEDWNAIRAELGNQRLLGMDYYSGGHLTHGYRHNVSAQMFDCHAYGVSAATGQLDYDAIEAQAREVKPLILLAGYSAYPRAIDFKRMRAIADAVGAVFMVDMAHFAGLVAGGVFVDEQDPVAHAHVVTSTTHKTLRGPRGGIILCINEFADAVDRGCPLVMGGPLPHVMAAKAVALVEASKPEFATYAQQIRLNARALAKACIEEGLSVVTNGTDNHLMLVNVTGFGLSGRQAESALRDCGITLNRNSLPNDPNGPWYTSGLRIGTPAITTLGMMESEMSEVAGVMALVLKNTVANTIEGGKNAGKTSQAKYTIDATAAKDARARVDALLSRFPVYPQLDLEFLQRHFG